MLIKCNSVTCQQSGPHATLLPFDVLNEAFDVGTSSTQIPPTCSIFLGKTCWYTSCHLPAVLLPPMTVECRLDVLIITWLLDKSGNVNVSAD